jgi:hypothetical protein
MFIRNLLFSCASCLNGHRPRECKHEDRPLYALKNKGRPGAGTTSTDRAPDLLYLDHVALDSLHRSVMSDPVSRKMYFHEAPPTKKPRKPTDNSRKSAPKKSKTPVDIYAGQLSPEQVLRWMELCGLDPNLPFPFPGPISTASSVESFPSTTDTTTSTLPSSEEEDLSFLYQPPGSALPQVLTDEQMDFILQHPALYAPASTSTDDNFIVATEISRELTTWDSDFPLESTQDLHPDIILPTAHVPERATVDPQDTLMSTTSSEDTYEPLFSDTEQMDEMLYYNDPLSTAESTVVSIWNI